MQPTESTSQPPLMPSTPTAGPPQPPTPQPTDPPVTNSTSPELADDGDLIEKEWVQQVKRIVQTTTDDPYQQSAQFTQLKAQYLQKRYGKRLKADK